jgi:hypothetical protein
LELPDVGIDFSAQDWLLVEKDVKALKAFEEATNMLSSSDATISSVIPIVTTIIKSLETSSADRGILGMKRSLKQSMEAWFQSVESTKNYLIATLLDTKFKRYFFRCSDSFAAAELVSDTLFRRSV